MTEKLGYCLADHPLNGRWWLMDWETSALSADNGEIIQLSGALLDHFTVKETFVYYIHPKKPVSPGILRLTGIPQDVMDQADFSPGAAVKRLAYYAKEAPLLFWVGNFQLPFLKKLFREQGTEFALPYLLLDRAAELVLGQDFDRHLDALIKKLGISVISHCNQQYLDRYSALYQFLANRLNAQGIHTVSQLEQLDDRSGGFHG